MSDLHEELLEAFREEYREHLEGMRTSLAALEASGEDRGAHLEEALRQAHSLKAAARICDILPLEALTQRLEGLFARLSQGAVSLDGQAFAAARLALDAVAAWGRAWEAGQTPPNETEALQAVDRLLAAAPSPAGARKSHEAVVEKKSPPPEEAREEPEAELDAELLAAFQMEHHEHLEGIRAMLAEAETAGPNEHLIHEIFRRAHSLKGCARTVGLRPAEVVAHRLESLFAQVREGALQLTAELIGSIHRGLEFIDVATTCMLEKQALPDPAATLGTIDAALTAPLAPLGRGEPLAPLAPLGRGVGGEGFAAAPIAERETGNRTKQPRDAAAPAPVDAVRVSADHLDRLLGSAEQLLAEGLGQDRALRELDLLRREAGELAREWGVSVTGAVVRKLAAAPETARVARFLTHVEERLRALARRARHAYRLHRQSSGVLHLLGRQLQQDVRRARTVPAENVFQGFRKMMRDLAHAEGKEIDFRTVGLEVQADRLVLQALKDPLMHVLRNAVVHGVEPPDDRRRQGKPPAGRVALALEIQGNRLHVAVEDDGRGVDAAAVAAEAVRRRLLTEAEAAELDVNKLTQLVFQPGFSTAAAVTDLAGRGMGLSVVYEAVTRLQGAAQLTRPDTGRGTRLRLSVPLSVTAQRLLLTSCRGQTFALSAHSIESLRLCPAQEIEIVGGTPMLLGGDEPIPLQALAHLLGMPADDGVSGPLPVVVVRLGSRRLAVSVDALLGARDALIRDLGPPAGRDNRWSGGILLDDGSVCLVLNPAALFDANPHPPTPSPSLGEGEPERSLHGRGGRGRRSGAPPEKRTILVVDDSLTTRTLEKSLLEAHGYRVVVALDGMEALARLRESLPDLVITDVQMPRLDGFGLLEQIKKDPRLARLPVIVVTSLERREDQERGLALGADAYIVKRKFDHEELLHTVRQIL